MTHDRQQELGENLAKLRQKIDEATRASGRDEAPELIVVTKFFPVSDLITLAELGVTDVGENRVAELTEKFQYLTDERPEFLECPRRHFIGQLQSNKAKQVVHCADVVQSLDRPKLVPLLDAAAGAQGRILDVTVQVDLEQHSVGRGGVRPDSLDTLAQVVTESEHLRLRGLMCVAPRDERPAHAFARLAKIREAFLKSFPQAQMLSAGMSTDFAEAIAIGATHVRVGSAILGFRPQAG